MSSDSAHDDAELLKSLQAAGIPIDAEQLKSLLDAGVEVRLMLEEEMWAEKRARQARDLELVRSGRCTSAKMSWFSGGWAKNAKLVNSPY